MAHHNEAPLSLTEMTREELLEARANVEREITELSYSPVVGGGGGTASPRPALLSRLNAILAEIDRELSESSKSGP